jgi:cytoskeleton protein RodZ
VDEPGALGPGALLAAERSAQGLGVGDIARQLKLSMRQVEALERDDYDAFAGMVFVRGFLRNYAKLLDVDPEPLVAMTYSSSAEPPPMTSLPVAEEAAAARTAGPRRGWLLGAVVLIALMVAAIFEGRQREAPRSVFESLPAPVPGNPQQREAPRSALEPAPAAPVPGSPQHAESPPPGGGASAAADPAPAAVVAAPAASAAREDTAPPAVESAAPVSPNVPAPADEKQLRLAFDGASWVEVKDSAGAVIFSQLNDPGTEQVVRGRAPLSVVIGNAHNVRLSYGDRPVDLGPHTNVDVARLVLE